MLYIRDLVLGEWRVDGVSNRLFASTKRTHCCEVVRYLQIPPILIVAVVKVGW